MNPDAIRRHWAGRSGAYSPEYYAYYGPDETSARVRERLDAFVGPTAAVLELGCGPGRHLAHLREHGYRDLSGIDVNGEAFDVLAREYPALADEGTFHAAAIEDTVAEFDDGQFDAVYSVETLQHLPPDSEWVFGELSRITGDLLITVEHEGDADRETGGVNHVDGEFPLYYRNWRRIFAERGFVQVDSASLERDTLRVFRTGAE